MDLITSYKKCFLGKHASPIFYRREEESWKHPSFPESFSDSLIKDHLSGKTVVGQYLSDKYTTKAYIDIDYDPLSPVSRDDWKKEVIKIWNLFYCPKLIVKSSENFNVHIILYFRSTLSVVAKATILSILESNGLSVSPGKIEIFVGRGSIRLPFGEGSGLLDLDSSKNEIKLSAKDRDSFIKDFALSLDYKELPDISLLASRGNVKRTTKKALFSGVKDESTAIDLIEFGVTKPSSMNLSIMKVVQHYYRITEGDVNKTKQLTLAWVHSFPEQHRKLSKDYLRGRVHINKKIDSAVENWHSKQSLRTFSLSSSGEVPEVLCDIIFENFSNYKLQKKVFNLCKLFVHQKTLFLSKSFLTNKKDGLGLASSNYKKTLNILQDEGIISQLRSGSSIRKHPNVYSCDLSGLDQDRAYTGFHNYLRDNSLIMKYSRYQQKFIKLDLLNGI